MKNNKIFYTIMIGSVILAGTLSSCKKDFLDINENPNFPADVQIEQILPSAQVAIAHAVGNNLQIYGGLWAQYWTQSPTASQYKTFEQYAPISPDFDFTWAILYSDALKELKVIEKKAAAEGRTNYAACAKILEAYSFQVLTDNFGDIPFSEALRAEDLIVSPKYDSQENVYDGIITLLNEGLAAIDDTSENAIFPGADDLLFGGDMNGWRKFGNTLKLRVYLRLAYVSPGKAQTGIAGLVAEQAEFLASGEEVKINYTTEGGNTNPLYSAYIGVGQTQNLVASATAINFLDANADPRIDAFYTPANNGAQLGIPQGAYNLSASTLVSIPSPLTGGDGGDESSALAPVKLMTGYESLFLQAEAAQRGWLTSGDPQALYESAITENFVSYGLTAGDASTYYAQPQIAFPASGSSESKIESIMTQKWIALCGNGNDEAWIEWRRTGYPLFFTVSANSSLSTGLFPHRFFYPNNEVTRNVNFPGQPLITEKVWWDVN